MGTQLTPKHAVIALAVGMVVLLAAFYVPMVVLGGKHDLLEWLLPAILIVSVFAALPICAALMGHWGQPLT